MSDRIIKPGKRREFAVRYPSGYIRIMPSRGSARLEAADTGGKVIARSVTAMPWESA
jgi:hypothetical protein